MYVTVCAVVWNRIGNSLGHLFSKFSPEWYATLYQKPNTV